MTAIIPALFALVAVLLLSQHSIAVESATGNSDVLVRAIKAHITNQTFWQEEEIEVRSIANLTRLDLPQGNVTFRVIRGTPPGNYRSLMLPIEASLDGKAVGTYWIRADVAIQARILRAARRLPFGGALSLQDVQEVSMEIPNPNMPYLRRMDEAVGTTLRRTLSPGDPLTRDCIASPFLVRSGETVRISLKYGSVSLAALARAEQNGRLGQVIRVRNLDFPRPVQAEVTGPGEVRIE